MVFELRLLGLGKKLFFKEKPLYEILTLRKYSKNPGNTRSFKKIMMTEKF